MRAWIASLLLLMFALPFMLADRPFTVPSSSLKVAASIGNPPTLPGTADHWLDFFRTLAGAFAGAGAAFLANRKLQDAARIREELAAGNYAMHTISRMYDGYRAVRLGFQQEIKFSTAKNALIEPWILTRPIEHFFRDDLQFDFDELTFLLEVGDAEVFERLQVIEQLYNGLLISLKEFNLAAKERQQKLSDAGLDKAVDLDLAEAIIGNALLGRLQSMFESAKLSCDTDEPYYATASQGLHAALAARFGSGSVFSPIIVQSRS